MIRNPIPWRNKARCAACVAFGMDADSLIHIAHPFATGRLARCHVVREFLEHGMTRGGVWFAPMEQTAAHVRSCVDDGKWPRESTGYRFANSQFVPDRRS